MEVDWELSQSLTSDGQGIRCVCKLPPETEGDAFSLLTGTQSGGLVAYGVPSGNLRVLDFQHDHSCTALVSNDSVYITGCKDSIIRVFDAKTHELVNEFRGHEKPVTSLTLFEDFLVSGSWDGTAKVWRLSNKSLITSLEGHENSVCVTLLDGCSNGILRIATGSAGIAQNNVIQGHSIRIYEVDTMKGGFRLLNTVSNDHEGPIRGVCLADGWIASCSNDGTCKLRSSDNGEAVTTLTFISQQHPPMLLDVAAPGDHCLVAGAEDGHLVSWNVGDSSTSPQVIAHPQCIWSVFALPNGDFCTCCDDGILRIFTKAEERLASEEERDTFAKEVQALKQKQSNGPSAEEIAKLPLWQDNALNRGKSEGQVQVFNKDGIAIAAQWSAASQTWIEVGQVMGNAGQDSGTINGTQYDHVLPIEVDQTGGGVAKLQIGYNTGENPFVAAQRFIDDHMLPQHHLNEIADYIRQRVGNEAPTLGMDTGAPAAITGTPVVSYEYLPSPGYKQFGLSDKAAGTMLEKMKKKILEFGKLAESEVLTLETLLGTLEATNRFHSSKISDSELKVVVDMLDWEKDQVFPALDLARLIALHPDASSASRAAYWSNLVAKVIDIMNSGCEGPAIPMLGLRVFSNAIKGDSGSCGAVISQMGGVLTVASKYSGSGNKNVRLSLSTLLYNLAHYVKLKPDTEMAPGFIPLVTEILSSRVYEGEAIFRTLVATGTFVLTNPAAKDAAKAAFLSSKVEMAASPHGADAKAAAKEVYAVLQ